MKKFAINSGCVLVALLLGLGIGRGIHFVVQAAAVEDEFTRCARRLEDRLGSKRSQALIRNIVENHKNLTAIQEECCAGQNDAEREEHVILFVEIWEDTQRQQSMLMEWLGGSVMDYIQAEVDLREVSQPWVMEGKTWLVNRLYRPVNEYRSWMEPFYHEAEVLSMLKKRGRQETFAEAHENRIEAVRQVFARECDRTPSVR